MIKLLIIQDTPDLPHVAFLQVPLKEHLQILKTDFRGAQYGPRLGPTAFP